MSNSSRLTSLIAVPFLLLPAAAAADKSPRPLADAALDGTNTATDKRITKAFFFVGPYFIRYDWGKDRVDDGYPVAINPNALKDPGWSDGIRAANSVFGEPDSFLFRGKQLMIFDWNPNTADPVVDLKHFPNGVDSVVHGLGAEHNFDYFFVGGEYVKFDRRTKTPGDRGTIAERFVLHHVDAAVNGAGNFIGFAYLFQDDSYVKYDWASGRVVGGKPKLTQPNFPGLVEIMEAAHALKLSRTWYDAALPALETGAPSPATITALGTTFGIATAEQRAAHLPEIIRRLQAAAARTRNPEGTFRFRTAAEAKKDGFDGRAIYADAAGGISVTPAFHALPATCQAALTVELMLHLGGLTAPPAAPATIAERLQSPTSYRHLVQALAGATTDGPCRK